jgi:hypothetical protein
VTPLPAGPGDVLAVTMGGKWPSRLIAAGQALAGKASPAEHVVIITHQDAAGRWMGIAGQPGGVAMCDCTSYLADSRTASNHLQPKPGGTPVMTLFLAACAKSLGLDYDWAGIAIDTAADLGVPNLSAAINYLWRWTSDPADSQLHGEVVCSSLAAMLYDLSSIGWKHPDLGTERICQPSDWWLWNNERKWL